MRTLAFLFLSLTPFLSGVLAQQCGSQAGGASCPGGLCCSKWGYCGTTTEYCSEGCQSNCKGAVAAETTSTSDDTSYTTTQAGDLGSIITQPMFDNILKHRGEGNCRGRFYTYNAFVNAAKSFPGFGTTGTTEVRKREIAAFLAQTSHETTGGWATAPDGPFAWGYCFVQEQGNPGAYCDPKPQFPCAPGKKYFGRGPMQLSWNYNYGQAGKAIGVDLLNNPDLLLTDPVISFKSAIWFWMTPQAPKPSAHDVISGRWQPSPADRAANRLPGYGVITNIINGGLECGKGPDPRVQNRIGYYQRYCGILGVSPGQNLDCANQKPFGQ